MRGKIWTISNLLSLSRIFLMVPVVLFFMSSMKHAREYAALFILLAVVTDALDGYLARLLHQESEVGKVIDPLADKVGVGIVVVLLCIFGDIPFWYAFLVLGRDVIILLGGIYIRRRKGIILPSNMPGKFAVSIVALALVLALLRYPIFAIAGQVSLWLSTGLLAVSFVVYTKRFIVTLKAPPVKHDQALTQ